MFSKLERKIARRSNSVYCFIVKELTLAKPGLDCSVIKDAGQRLNN